jgi:L-threonylcarbamoyladenylate synthase
MRETKTIHSPELIQQAVRELTAGGVVVYPTDTVYGLGADATNPAAVERVRQLKGRDAKKPILALVADLAMLEAYAKVTPLARALAGRFLPGPLTLVLEARDDRLAAIQAADGSLGFRIPDHPTCTQLIQCFGKPITSTSVNRSGEPQARQVADMVQSLQLGVATVDCLLDAGELPVSAPSTVVDARGSEIQLLREGVITKGVLASVRC